MSTNHQKFHFKITVKEFTRQPTKPSLFINIAFCVGAVITYTEEIYK